MADLSILSSVIDAFKILPLEKLILLVFAYQLWIQQKSNRERFKETQENIRNAVGKTILENKQLLQIASDAVKAKSVDKLSFIRDLLNEPDLYENRVIYEKRISSELIKQSNEYYLKLNQYMLSSGKLLGDWTEQNFQGYADNFISKIYKIVFNQKLSIEKKVSAIESIMMEVQNDLWDDLKSYINNK